MENEDKKQEPPVEKGKDKKSGKSTGTSTGRTKIEIDVQRYIIGGVIIALFVGFIGVLVVVDAIIVDAFRSKEASYQDLINKINSSNRGINTLCQQSLKKDCIQQ